MARTVSQIVKKAIDEQPMGGYIPISKWVYGYIDEDRLPIESKEEKVKAADLSQLINLIEKYYISGKDGSVFKSAIRGSNMHNATKETLDAISTLSATSTLDELSDDDLLFFYNHVVVYNYAGRGGRMTPTIEYFTGVDLDHIRKLGNRLGVFLNKISPISGIYTNLLPYFLY